MATLLTAGVESRPRHATVHLSTNWNVNLRMELLKAIYTACELRENHDPREEGALRQLCPSTKSFRYRGRVTVSRSRSNANMGQGLWITRIHMLSILRSGRAMR